MKKYPIVLATTGTLTAVGTSTAAIAIGFPPILAALATIGLAGLSLKLVSYLNIVRQEYVQKQLAVERRKTLALEDRLEEENEELLDTAREKVGQLVWCAERITTRKVKVKTYRLIKVAHQIIKHIENHPTKIKRADSFINYYLETSTKLLFKYVELSSQQEKVSLNEVEDILNKIDDSLQTLQTSFKNQLGKMISNDIVDLEAEVRLLKQIEKNEQGIKH